MCYNLDCKDRESCDQYKKAICLFRLSAAQYKLKNDIKNKERGLKPCPDCGRGMVKGRYKGKRTHICTSCGIRGTNSGTRTMYTA